jgi:uncharacterized protein YukE
MKRALVLVVFVSVACTKHEEQTTSSVVAPVTLPSVSASATAIASATVAPVDAGPITACGVSFSCGLSHPGLGSSSRTTSVDLGKCERTSWSESGPWRPTRPRKPPEKTTSKVAATDCERLRDLASTLGPADARAASESAHMDSEARSLSIMCAGDAAARFDVQRQTTTGATRVEQTIRAVLGYAAP